MPKRPTYSAFTKPQYFELRGIEVFPRELRSGAMLARFTGRFEGEVAFTHNMALDVVFGRDCAAASARRRSVVASLAHIREFVVTQLMPALTVFFDGEYTITRNSGEANTPSAIYRPPVQRNT